MDMLWAGRLIGMPQSFLLLPFETKKHNGNHFTFDYKSRCKKCGELDFLALYAAHIIAARFFAVHICHTAKLPI